jgi:hypothetical protein
VVFTPTGKVAIKLVRTPPVPRSPPFPGNPGDDILIYDVNGTLLANYETSGLGRRCFDSLEATIFRILTVSDNEITGPPPPPTGSGFVQITQY